jgi:hypothetical protein
VNVAALGLSLSVLGVGDAVLKVSIGIDGSNLWRFFTGLVGGYGLSILGASIVIATSNVVVCGTCYLRRNE